jgi:hypothetical protein
MIIEELKSFLRATILISSDMTKKEFSLELLEKIIAMEQKLKAMEMIDIEPPVADLPAGGVSQRLGDSLPKPWRIDRVGVELKSDAPTP